MVGLVKYIGLSLCLGIASAQGTAAANDFFRRDRT